MFQKYIRKNSNLKFVKLKYFLVSQINEKCSKQSFQFLQGQQKLTSVGYVVINDGIQIQANLHVRRVRFLVYYQIGVVYLNRTKADIT